LAPVIGRIQNAFKTEKNICSKIFTLLQRDEVLNQFSPDKETIDKMQEYGSEESYHGVVDQMIPQVEQVFAEGDEMPQIFEHHVSEEIREDVFEETLPNVEYCAAEDSEGDVFDETTQSIGRQITEDFGEEVIDEVMDRKRDGESVSIESAHSDNMSVEQK
jgi:uncharacterized membrane-anchored protein YjiN (DUF445 family)